MNIIDIISCPSELPKFPQIPDHLSLRLKGFKKINAAHPDNEGVKHDFFFFATVYLYSLVPLSLSQRHVVVMGEVFDDGIGDYYHILNAAEWIKAKFPSVKLTMLVNHIDDNLPSAVQKLPEFEIETHFSKNDAIPDHIYPLLQSADYIIEMSQKSEDQGIIDITLEKGNNYRYIGEYGHWSMQPMGVKSNHLGIIIKDRPSISSLLCLKNAELKQVLFGTMTPSKEDLKNYLKIHEPFVGYLKMGSYYQMGLIYTVAALLKSSKKSTVDLIIPQVKIKFLCKDFLREQGIAKIEVIRIQGGHIAQEEVVLAEQGKVLRLIDPFPLDQMDFYTLLTCTSPLVGCTGDHSISEVISFDRLPFYELRKMKKGFLDQLILLSKHPGKESCYFKQYLEELRSIYDDHQESVIDAVIAFARDPEVPEKYWPFLNHFLAKQPQIIASALKLAQLLQQPGLFEEARKLNSFLKANCSFYPLFQNILERQFALLSNPDLQKSEEEIRLNYLQGRFTLDEALSRLYEKISKTLL